MQTEAETPAGIWIRFHAGFVDLSLVVVVVLINTELLARSGVYIPIELSAILGYAIYTAVAVTFTGASVGKWLCGLRVLSTKGEKAHLVRSSIRALAVMVSQCLFGLPLLLIGARRSKRGLHDVLAGTRVVLESNAGKCQTRTVGVVSLVLLACVGSAGYGAVSLFHSHRKWIRDAESLYGLWQEHNESIIEASSVSDTTKTEMTAWLREHGKEPKQFLIDAAKQHQVTIVGEIHGKQQYLKYLIDSIPGLYHSAGVRVIALECCHPDSNDELRKLVTSKLYDPDLALKIARSSVWSAWGWKGYWDVLETAWQFNQSLPPETDPLELVGISPPVDLPSFRLVLEGPWTEKFRLMRVLDDLPQLFMHDAFYAQEVERKAFHQGKKTLVWVGAAHTTPGCSYELRRGDRVISRRYRMGAMLFGRYGERVTQIVLHTVYSQGEIARLIEQGVEPHEGQSVVAFVTANSPFASLRDSETWCYQALPGRTFQDLAQAYVIVAPHELLAPSDWWTGFVSSAMFGENKPFYELMCERDLRDHLEADEGMREGIKNL